MCIRDRAEYHYFCGQPEAAVREAEAYLSSPDMGARFSASLLYAYANLPLGAIPQAKFALGQLIAFLSEAGEQSPQYQAASAFVASTGAVLLHLPMPEEMPEIETFLPLDVYKRQGWYSSAARYPAGASPHRHF